MAAPTQFRLLTDRIAVQALIDRGEREGFTLQYTRATEGVIHDEVAKDTHAPQRSDVRSTERLPLSEV